MPTSRAGSAPRAASPRAGSKRSSTASSRATATRTTSTPFSTWPSAVAAPRSARSTTAPSAPTSPTSKNSAPSSRPYAEANGRRQRDRGRGRHQSHRGGPPPRHRRAALLLSPEPVDRRAVPAVHGGHREDAAAEHRVQHAGGRRVARLKPRLNEAVNAWWICDVGRYGFDAVDDPSRIRFARHGGVDVTRDEALGLLVAALRDHAPDEIAILASPELSNEDLFALRRLAEHRGIRQLAFGVPPGTAGADDDFLLRADRHPNTRGAEAVGFAADADSILARARAGALKVLWVIQHDLPGSAWPTAATGQALERLETLIFTGTNENGTSTLAPLVLPLAAWVERDGTFTNFLGRVQRFRAAVEPLGDALAGWDLFGRVLTLLGGVAAGGRAELWFRELAKTVPA